MRLDFRKVFGWTEEPQQMPHGTYTLFKNGADQVGGMMQAGPEKQLTPK